MNSLNNIFSFLFIGFIEESISKLRKDLEDSIKNGKEVQIEVLLIRFENHVSIGKRNEKDNSLISTAKEKLDKAKKEESLFQILSIFP